MTRLSDFLTMRFFPERPQVGLAILRVWTGATLFLRHGWEKNPTQWTQFMARFGDPIGIGPHPSFLIAFVSDFVCAILLMLGLGTRWASLWCMGNIFVAWAFVHHFVFLQKVPGSDHGEVIVLYLGALLTIFVAGPGAASIDRMLSRKP
jgi:putative oxidoreductase